MPKGKRRHLVSSSRLLSRGSKKVKKKENKNPSSRKVLGQPWISVEIIFREACTERHDIYVIMQ
jgi:hypothetical protein